MSSRFLIRFGVFALLAGGAIVFVKLSGPATPPDSASHADPVPATAPQADANPARPQTVSAPSNVFIGQHDPKLPRAVNTVMTTRKGDATYQGLIRYNPIAVPLTDVPGLMDVLHYFSRQGKQLPETLARVDQETETLIDNLGQPLRSISSTHLFLNPIDGRVIAYDLANTTGGQAQRFVGHLTRSGITVEVYRGADPVDKHEIPFSAHSTHIPVEMEFIHQWYQREKEAWQKKEPVKFNVFIPEVMSFVLLVARPIGDEVIPIKDANHECARYEVETVSTQSSEGLRARQQMWFSKKTGMLMRREDYDAALGPGDAPVTEQGAIESLGQLSELIVRPPVLPEKMFPYRLDRDWVYSVKVGEGELGKIRVNFSRPPEAKGGHAATAVVNFDARGVARHETAVTLFNEKWLPTHYQASGDEAAEADAKAKYKVGAKLAGGKIDVALFREMERSADPELKTAAPNGDEARKAWQEPLKNVPISDDEARAEENAQGVTKLTNQSFSRNLSLGTFLYDFNRVEHLAAIAYRFPLPPASDGNAPAASVFQKVAIFSVRQNHSGVILFEIKPEPKPALTERQKLRLSAAERNEPPLYIATASSALLPCRMLLAPDGRMLELSLKIGNSDVTYTLDDPIMRDRAERARKQKLQEGPQIIRPPWW